ncbi:hypothetical protein QNH36_23715 [Mesobacillus sp. AQ2]|uniref:nucleotidyltransferase domain-containing protein n=1 Tax=Mesobacillus sp. AQ2 TaxID=3043332 RepID=UPI0024C1F83D|nr:nucleotidyltransferase domain-containing protein [Mesobacillus sp. AQ2]WHX40606.1 hypothetical protein QNH36_23715 [Mesobacillus sp. AQ2]
MGNPILITCLQQRMNENKQLIACIKEYEINFYLFGSILHKENPRDIDLLMVYNQHLISIKSVLNLKNEIVNYLNGISPIQVDLLLLSLEEELEVNFIKSEKAVDFDLY